MAVPQRGGDLAHGSVEERDERVGAALVVVLAVGASWLKIKKKVRVVESRSGERHGVARD